MENQISRGKFQTFSETQELINEIDPKQRAWIEVNSKAIENNTKTIKSLIPSKCLLMAVVKADGYGHGAVTVARATIKGGADSLGVATLQEGIELRKANLACPILILGNLTGKAELKTCLFWKIIPTVSNMQEALMCQSLAEDADETFDIHLKVDTGMGRLGCDLNEAEEILTRIKHIDKLRLKGLYSHLALADQESNLDNKSSHFDQKEKFKRLLTNLSPIDNSICIHLANSAGTIRDNELHFDMVRVGLALYGYNPIPWKSDLNLHPSLSVKAKISLIREVPAGTGIGYGHTFITKRNSRIAIVGIGYADGISRNLSGKINGLINGARCPQIGSITMDQLVLDITDQNQIQQGDIVTLLGQDGHHSITANEWSQISGTIAWEVLCGFKHRLPRIVI